MIFARPGSRQIVYTRLPSENTRILIIKDLISPTAVALDQGNFRLFVVDAPAQKIYWFQLIALPTQRLLYDGQLHVAVSNVIAKSVAVDARGNLYYTGKSSLPGVNSFGLWKQPFENILNSPDTPTSLWTAQNSGVPSKVSMPGSLITDGFSLTWANTKDGSKVGSLVRAPVDPTSSGTTIVAPKAFAMNLDVVDAVVSTPRFLYYAHGGTIYGIAKNKASSDCTPQTCVLVTDQLKRITSMVWDAEGTVYVTDTELGALYSFPSGELDIQDLTKVLTQRDMASSALLTVDASKKSFARVASCFLFLAAAVF